MLSVNYEKVRIGIKYRQTNLEPAIPHVERNRITASFESFRLHIALHIGHSERIFYHESVQTKSTRPTENITCLLHTTPLAWSMETLTEDLNSS
jgi:hypothetical protein